jgi:hypothetical protein
MQGEGPDGNSTEGVVGSKEGGKGKEKATPKLSYKDVTKTRRKTIRTPLTVGGVGLLFHGLSPEGLQVTICPLEFSTLDPAGLSSLRLHPTTPGHKFN